MQHIKNIFLKYKVLFIIILLGSLLFFPNLGDRFLSGDELHTSLISKSILKYYKPTIVDGNRVYADAISAENSFNTEQLIRAGEINLSVFPYLHFYVVALGFKLFGLNSFGGRVFPALFGFLTLPLIYFTALKISNNKKKSMLTTFLLAVCVPFYLYSRQARYYSMAAFFSLLVFFSYIKLVNKEKNSSIWLIVSSILLFHTQYLSFVIMAAGIAIHSLLIKRFLEISKSGLIISLFTLPWFLINNPFNNDFYSLVASFASFSQLIVTLVMPPVYILLYVFPLVFVPFVCMVKRNTKINLILIIVALTPLIEMLIVGGTSGLRHYVFLFPLLMLLLGEVFYYIYQQSKIICLSLLVLFIFTNAVFVAPFLPIKGVLLDNLKKDGDAHHFVTDTLELRSLIKDYIYEITHDYKNPSERIIEKINEVGFSNDDVFLTDTEAGSLLFYTDMINYRESLNKTPDWIIPRKPYSLWVDRKRYDYVAAKITGSYEKIQIDSVDYICTNDEPNPRSRRFEWVSFPEGRYDTYPIEIYRLKK